MRSPHTDLRADAGTVGNAKRAALVVVTASVATIGRLLPVSSWAAGIVARPVAVLGVEMVAVLVRCLMLG